MKSNAAIATQIRAIPTNSNAANMPKSHQDSFWERWFLPHQETQVVAQQAAKGVFIPWPLLAIIVTLAIVLVTGLVTIQVQVSNLSTTLLLRDADHARQVEDLKREIAKETERRELTDLKVSDMREKQAARGRN